MARKLTARQRQVLDHIKSELRRKGYPPSVREIGEAIGLSSSSTVHGHLARLEEKGYIRRDRTKPRAIEILEADGQTTILQPLVNVPVLGRVTAGQPILAVQNVEEYFPVPLDFTRDEDVFFLQIRGDSMIEAGILNGDYVLVHQQTTADNGDIVVAMIEDEATVKRFFREANHIRLQPENSLMEPLIVQHCAILGKVTGLIRRIN